ncbi:MAG: BRO family protein, partial [bacterium]|nr:BRO family protein [bacterium]
MNAMQIFRNTEFGELGVLVVDGKELFPATECARMLGYTDPYDAINRHTKGSVKHRVLTTGGEQELKFIPEGDLF